MGSPGSGYGQPERALAVSTFEAAKLAGVGRTTIYEAIQSGALKSLKIGKRRLIRIDALEQWLSAQEVAS
jgi:excisionase family DNA binding protein